MPVDYSKWDALELSDDSDIEVHPNVDKKSFIRAKQNQIHQQRFERRHKIDTYKYERIINDGLLVRINALLSALQSHQHEAETRNVDEVLFQAIIEAAGKNADGDMPRPRPAGVHTGEKEPISYSKMMAALVDQVKGTVSEDKSLHDGKGRYEAYVKEIGEHKSKVDDLQRQLLEQLNDLEREEGRKITSEGLRDGFNSSSVSKADPITLPDSTSSNKKGKLQTVEMLNPKTVAARDQLRREDSVQSSGADADVDEPLADDDDEEDIEASPTARKFAQIRMGDYQTDLRFISQNPSLLAEKETDGLLVMALNAALEGKDDVARQCVHQGLLLQYCRALGKDGVGLFFKRITTQGHQAQKVFFDDVNSTFQHIRTRAKEILKQRAAEEAEGSGGVEQIQLHAVDPGTTINIGIPPANSEVPEEIEARKLFDAFPPGLQRALESGELDEVNKVLGKMSVEEAEEVVAQLSAGGMLSLEDQIIDATTEEGKAAVKELEEQAKAESKAYAESAEHGAQRGHTSDPE